VAIATVNFALHFRTVCIKPFAFGRALVLGLSALIVLCASTIARGDVHEELEVLRVDVPLQDAKFRNGELQLGTLITNTTYIDINDFNLRAVELEASSTQNGEVRLKVGRYVTPPVPLPGPDTRGLLRIEAPHKSNKSWRLLFEDRVSITSLTAVLEPRSENSDYYASRYTERGYTFGNDPNYQPYNRRSAHWFWLNNPRSSTFFNQSYGNNHLHSARCYDRFGRHLGFSSGFNRGFGGTAFNRDRIERIGPVSRTPISRTPSKRPPAAPQPVPPAAQLQQPTPSAIRRHKQHCNSTPNRRRRERSKFMPSSFANAVFESSKSANNDCGNSNVSTRASSARTAHSAQRKGAPAPKAAHPNRDNSAGSSTAAANPGTLSNATPLSNSARLQATKKDAAVCF